MKWTSFEFTAIQTESGIVWFYCINIVCLLEALFKISNNPRIQPINQYLPLWPGYWYCEYQNRTAAGTASASAICPDPLDMHYKWRQSQIHNWFNFNCSIGTKLHLKAESWELSVERWALSSEHEIKLKLKLKLKMKMKRKRKRKWQPNQTWQPRLSAGGNRFHQWHIHTYIIYTYTHTHTGLTFI